VLYNSFGKEIFPNTYLPTSFQVAVESKKVSPQPPLLQTKQSQFPQLLLIRLVLYTLHQLNLETVFNSYQAPWEEKGAPAGLIPTAPC